MKMIGRILLIGVGVVFSVNLLHAQTGTGGSSQVAAMTPSNLAAMVAVLAQTTPLPPESIPRNAALYSAQNPQWPPFPGNFNNLPAWSLGGNAYLLDDLDYDYEAAAQANAMMRAMDDGPPAPGGGGDGGGIGSGGGSGSSPPVYGANDLWVEGAMTNASLGLLVHTPNPESFFDLFYVPSLPATNGGWWWIARGLPGQTTFVITNLQSDTGFFLVGTTNGMDALGITDACRALVGETNALTNDLDQDGLPDWWEIKYFGDLSQPGSAANLAAYNSGADPNTISFSVNLGYQCFNSCQVAGQFELLGGVPAYSAVLVGNTNTDAAVWSPYNGSAAFTLGATDGVYSVLFGLKGRTPEAQPVWVGTSVLLDRVAPEVHITSPLETTTSKPIIQVQGFSPEALWSVSYSISNAAGLLANLDGLLVSGYEAPTNAFQLFDVQLTNGLNVLTLAVQDTAGNVTVTNLEYVLDYSNVTNGPALQVFWPQDQSLVSGTNFTLRGQVDDESATITLEAVGASGETNTLGALVERNGAVWVDDVPLEAGTNFLTLTAVNAAGLSNMITLAVVQSDVILTIQDVPADQLNQAQVTVTGTISDTGYKVWVNGVAAVLTGNDWVAASVPVTPGGSAVFAAVAIPLTDNGGNGTPPPSGQGTDPAALNPSSSGAPGASLQPEKPSEVKRVYGDWSGQSSASFLLSAFSGSFQASWFRSETNGGADAIAVGSEPGTGSIASGTHYTEGPSGHLWEDWEDDPTNIVYSSADDTPDLGFTMVAGIFYWNVEPMINWLSGATSSSGVMPAGNDKLSYTTSAAANNTRVVLRTGGRSGVGRQNLFVFTGSAWDRTKPNCPELPKQQLWVPGIKKYLGSDGLAYAVLPDNAEIPVTLRAPAPYYRFVVDATKYIGSIAANGWPLAPDRVLPNAKFCVGQKTVFTLEFDPPLPQGVLQTNNNYWVLPPKYVNAYEWFQPSMPTLTNNDGDYYITMCHPDLTVWVMPGYGIDLPFCTKYQQQGWPLSQPETGAWWVSGGNKLVSCYPTLTLTNGQKASLTVRGQFSVFRPTVTCTENPTGVVAVDVRSAPDIFLGLGDSTALSDFHWTLVASVSEDFPGVLSYVQLVNRNFSWDRSVWYGHLSESDSTGGERWLDKTDPYAAAPVVDTGTRQHPESGIAMPFGDGPCVQDDLYSFADATDALNTYLRFQPYGGIPITIARVDWNWHGRTDYTNAAWSLTASNLVDQVYTDDDSFAEWSKVYIGSGGD